MKSHDALRSDSRFLGSDVVRPNIPQAPLTMAHVMTPAPHTIGCDQKLAHAHDIMRRHQLRHLPVLEGGKLAGVLSQRDLYFVETLGGVDERVDRVSEAMASEVYTVAPGSRVQDVVKTMSERKLGCAIVVDRDHVVGIFTATDALALLAATLA